MNALEFEALASALSPAGRRVLLGPGGGRGGGPLGREGEEGLAVGWPLLPVCSFTSKPQCVKIRAPGSCFPGQGGDHGC